MQLGFFDMDNRLDRLSKMGDALERINRVTVKDISAKEADLSAAMRSMLGISPKTRSDARRT